MSNFCRFSFFICSAWLLDIRISTSSFSFPVVPLQLIKTASTLPAKVCHVKIGPAGPIFAENFTVDDLLKDDQLQTGDKADKSQPDETQPIEKTAQVEESEEQSHDQIKGSQNEDQEHGNDQTEAK